MGNTSKQTKQMKETARKALQIRTLRRKGKNEIVLRGTGKVWIARDDERPPADSPSPNRSAKSVDGGKTWNDARLGTKDDLDGEYYVRLFLDQHSTDFFIADDEVIGPLNFHFMLCQIGCKFANRQRGIKVE